MPMGWCVELRQLRYLLAIAEEGSISAAARRLHLAQPTLSEQLRRLERELGTELLDRRSRPLRLTAAGQRLVPTARLALDELDQATLAVSRIRNGELGELRLGYTSGGLYDLALAGLQRFSRHHPGVAVTPVPLAAAEQLPAVAGGRVDLALARLTEPLAASDLEVTVLREERLLAVLPHGHGMIRPDLALAELAGESFIFFSRHLEPLVYDRYLAICQAAGFTPAIARDVTDPQTQALLVASGHGIALTGDGLAARFPGLTYLPLAGGTTVTALALIAAHAPPPTARAFIALLTGGGDGSLTRRPRRVTLP